MRNRFASLCSLVVAALLLAPAAFAQNGTHAPSAGFVPGGVQAPVVYDGVPLDADMSAVYSTETVTFLAWSHFPVSDPSDVTNQDNWFWTDFPGAGAFGDDPNVAHGLYGPNAYEIDANTGAHTHLGAVAYASGDPTEAATGMAWADGMMYVVSSVCNVASWLYTYDPSGPSLSLVGEVTGSPCLVSVGAGTDGTLYGHDIVNDNIVMISKVDGSGTTLGPTNFDGNFGQGMEYDPATGTMYMAAFNNTLFRAELRTVDLSNGNTTLVGVIGNGSDLLQYPYAAIVQGENGGGDECADLDLADNLELTYCFDVVDNGTADCPAGSLDERDLDGRINGFPFSADGYVCKTGPAASTADIMGLNDDADQDGGGCDNQNGFIDAYAIDSERSGPFTYSGTFSQICDGEVIGAFEWEGVFVKNFAPQTAAASGNALRATGQQGVDRRMRAETPDGFALEGNYPNPFNPTTQIAYQLPEASHVTITVYNALGQVVAQLVDGFVEAGRHEVNFDAAQLSAGTYLYVLEAGDFRAAERMVLLK